MAAATGAAEPIPLHYSGCERRCGHPAGVHDEVVATPRGLVEGLVDPTEQNHEGAPSEHRHRAAGRPDAWDYVRDGAEIYRQSFATIRAEADLAGLPADLAPVVVRMIHACGMVDLAGGRRGLAGVGRGWRGQALRDGAPVLCDAQMVAVGDHPVAGCRRTTTWSARCPTRGSRTLAAPARHDPQRGRAGAVAAAAGRRGRGHRQRADRAVPPAGDAGGRRARARRPWSASRSGSSARRSRRPRWRSSDHGVPYLVVHGRRGGSAMTAAAVNAIADVRE